MEKQTYNFYIQYPYGGRKPASAIINTERFKITHVKNQTNSNVQQGRMFFSTTVKAVMNRIKKLVEQNESLHFYQY